jgi:hypothetical protein
MTDFNSYYWEHRDVFRLAIGMGAVLLLQTALLLWAVRRLDELGHIRERLSRLADGLALLTDTTETGMATFARELERQQGPRASAGRSSTRASVSKRVVAAARKGEGLAAIAGRESLSESEVRLHVQLAQGRSSRAVALDPQP